MIGIIAQGVRLQMHADDTVVADKLPYRVADLFRLLAAKHLVAHGGIRRLLFDVGLV